MPKDSMKKGKSVFVKGLKKIGIEANGDRPESEELVSKHNWKIIQERQFESACKHIWTSYGFGFKCDKCGFYTGLWYELNHTISKEKELKK